MLFNWSDSSFFQQDMFVRAQISFNFASTSSGKSSLINTSSSFEEEIARNQVWLYILHVRNSKIYVN